MENRQKHYDVAVIGAGPAGMMAAGTAAKFGAKVILIEKNERPGIKLLLTGKGRCNITSAEDNLAQFIDAFGRNGKFLYSALHAFGIQDAIAFFNERGMPTKVERGKRVFPVSDKALDVLGVLLNYLKEKGVEVFFRAAVRELVKQGRHIEKIITSKGEIRADKYILCTGGLSYPSTGSSGEGFQWILGLGHKLVELNPALIPIVLKEAWIKELEGLTLKNVVISVYQSGRKMEDRFGEAIFTADGLSGPIILDISKEVGRLFKGGEVLLKVDFKPALEFDILEKRIQRDLDEKNNTMFKNSLFDLLPQKIIPAILRLTKIDPEKKANKITREERKKLAHLLKGLEFQVKKICGFDKAVVTAGGVCLKEIDAKSMRSKIIDNLYFAGEIMDLDGPTGGYNLQVCWSTGYVAGKSAAANKTITN